jgi:hypothetical protein
MWNIGGMVTEGTKPKVIVKNLSGTTLSYHKSEMNWSENRTGTSTLSLFAFENEIHFGCEEEEETGWSPVMTGVQSRFLFIF